MTTGAPVQQLLAKMPRRLFKCTPSRLAAFDCPRRYRFTYVDRPTPVRGPASAHNTLGAAVHVALHRWWQLERAKRTPESAELLLERNWQHNGFRDEAQSEQWRAIAQRWVRAYVAQLDPADEPVGVERYVATPTESLVLEGRVDRIDARGDSLVVVDYKTGRRPPTDDDARGSQALAMYVLAARRTLRRACTRVELHHLPSGGVAAFEHTDESLARHLQRAQQTADDIVAATDTLASGADRDDVFPARPTTSCSWCDFRAHCPEGRAASEARDPWSALPDPTVQ
ncbi:MAG TPA: PD-(D/E)XK nuclease family protein [Jatrophihabitantaceae bacterium]|nr:PD-(D/E)XK nuclease family protein [Jatrophihabitantaceae bacterium]